jgi:ABC-type arginine/histidine transport system permease subunit
MVGTRSLPTRITMLLQSAVLLFHLKLKMELARVSTAKWRSHVIFMPNNNNLSFFTSTEYTICQMLIFYN